MICSPQPIAKACPDRLETCRFVSSNRDQDYAEASWAGVAKGVRLPHQTLATLETLETLAGKGHMRLAPPPSSQASRSCT